MKTEDLKFSESFDSFVCVGDSISLEIGNVEYKAVIHFDECRNIDDDDCHKPDQSVTGCNDEQFAGLLKARKAWFNNEWFYCGIVVTAYKAGIELCSESLWGIEANYPDGDNSYLNEVANDLLSEVAGQIDGYILQMVEKLRS